MEDLASKIRNDTAVQGSIRRGKGNTSSTTTMNFLLDGKAVFAHFGDAMAINDGARVIVVCVQKSNGLDALAYNNLTNGIYGEFGGLLRMIGTFSLGWRFSLPF